MKTFGLVMAWKCPFFSLTKNKSGVHRPVASLLDKNRTTPEIEFFGFKHLGFGQIIVGVSSYLDRCTPIWYHSILGGSTFECYIPGKK